MLHDEEVEDYDDVLNDKEEEQCLKEYYEIVLGVLKNWEFDHLEWDVVCDGFATMRSKKRVEAELTTLSRLNAFGIYKILSSPNGT